MKILTNILMTYFQIEIGWTQSKKVILKLALIFGLDYRQMYTQLDTKAQRGAELVWLRRKTY